MIKSLLAGDVIVHRLSGELSPRDMLDARAFSALHLDGTNPQIGVLWDLHEAFLNRSDEEFQILLRATVNSKTPSPRNKRGFLVSRPRHFERVEAVLGRASVPWPWAVFIEEKQAFIWLTQT